MTPEQEWSLQDDLLEALRATSTAFYNLSQDKTIYPKIKEPWQRVCIALAKAEGV